MLRISKETKLSAEEIISLASDFFGKEGVGLEEKSRNDCCISFEGGGGHVSVTIGEGDRKQTVDVETREWEYQAKEFLGKL
jgi:hypothetical protein